MNKLIICLLVLVFIVIFVVTMACLIVGSRSERPVRQEPVDNSYLK